MLIGAGWVYTHQIFSMFQGMIKVLCNKSYKSVSYVILNLKI